MAKRKLKKVKVKGNRAFHYFETPNGEEVRVPCTLDEYKALGEKEAGQPEYKGLKWKGSTIEPEYDTPDGDLPDNSYAYLPDRDNKKVVIKIPEYEKPDVFDASEVVNDEVEIVL